MLHKDYDRKRSVEKNVGRRVFLALAVRYDLLNLQRLQNKVLRTTGSLPGCTPVRDLHTAFNVPYVYDYIITLCTQEAEAIRNHESDHVRSTGQDEARRRK
jgi:hypothetical protein